ncbi:unnamed protein product [Clonostachys rhizophaga]|uniref:Ribokinase n=1 Tax=Clonostachys rhizophaga TaxID=160324 RepID=A0A9N9VWL4_9HYPO|nr:unnamed protein product [Clonostachys rhizophaga]
MAVKPLIQVIGSLNTDITVTIPRVPEAGETLNADSYSIGAGGKGANQAVACGRAAFKSLTEQDIQVEIIGAVGANDPQVSSLLKPILHASGVDTDGVLEIEGATTGTSTIFVESDGQNRILFYPGANYDGMRDPSRLIDIATRSDNRYPDVVVLQGEIPRETTLELLGTFNDQSNKTQIVFNPAPAYPEGFPIEALCNLGVLIVNETECMLLARSMRVAALPLDVDPESLSRNHLDDIAHGFCDTVGVKITIVTLGSKGAYFATQSGIRDIVPSAKVDKVVDTTAAGDTFAGYFAAILARHIASNKKWEEFNVRIAIEAANTAAARCVQKAGSIQSIPFGYELC